MKSCANHQFPATAWNNHYTTIIKVFASIVLLSSLLFSTTAFAQGSLPICKKPNGTIYTPHCTSNDLSVVGAFLTAAQCYCTEGQSTSATLNFKLFNKTGSFRTSFAFFAVLVQKDASGNTISSSYLTRCKSGVPADQVSTISFDQPITFTCGATLTLTNVYLAWTDASDNRVCPLAFCDIAPKCGKPVDITITSLLTAKVTATVSCDNSPTGSITVSPSGGTGPYDITITNSGGTTVASYVDVTTAQTKTALGGGTYTVSVTDAANPACTYTTTVTVPTKVCCIAPPKPTVCETPAGLCGNGKVSLTITNAVVGDKYTVTQGTSPNFTYNQTQTATSSTLIFTGLTPGAGFTAYGVDERNGTSCKGPETSCLNQTVTTCSTLTAPATSLSKKEVQTFQLLPEAPAKVMAVPNPFNDRIKFTLESAVSGQGSLELYNMLGQKVKTVYQGYVEQGKVQTIEYNVPRTQRNNLIYVFRVGDQKTSGKLIGLQQ